jgi:hypothetical protein
MTKIKNSIKKMCFSDQEILESLKRYGINPSDSLSKRGVLAQARFDMAKIWPIYSDFPLDVLLDICLKEYPETIWIKNNTQNQRLDKIKDIIVNNDLLVE